MAAPTLRQLEYFVAACETGTVTAAAERAHLSQSAVSTALTDLEGTLDVQLFVRHSRGLTLTPAGERVLVEARRLLAGIEDLTNSARELGQSLSGGLVVGCYSTLAPILLPPVIADFVRHHPAIDLNFVEGSHREVQEMLRKGVCELAFLYDYQLAEHSLSSALMKQVILTFEPHVLLPLGHRLVQSPAVDLTDLVDEPMILFGLPPGDEYFLSFFNPLGSPNVRFRTSSFEMVHALVARGLGYSILTQRTGISTSYEGLPFVSKPMLSGAPGLDVVAVQLAGTRPTRRATAFLRQCLASVRRPGGGEAEGGG